MTVEFHEASYTPQRQTARVPMLVGLVLKMGLAKDERSANLVLIGIVVLCLLLIGGIWIGSAMSRGAVEPPVEAVTGMPVEAYDTV